MRWNVETFQRTLVYNRLGPVDTAHPVPVWRQTLRGAEQEQPEQRQQQHRFSSAGGPSLAWIFPPRHPDVGMAPSGGEYASERDTAPAPRSRRPRRPAGLVT